MSLTRSLQVQRLLRSTTCNTQLYFSSAPPRMAARNLNASGLTAEQTKGLPERQARSDEVDVINAMKDLYQCKPTQKTYSVYASNAIFHDPIGYAEGIDSIKAQFNGLAKLFPRADLLKFRVLDAPSEVPSGTILIDQDVSYFRKADASEPTKTVNSLLTIKRNSEGLVTHHTEEWNHSKVTTSEDGFFGMLQEYRKRATAGITNAFVSKD